MKLLADIGGMAWIASWLRNTTDHTQEIRYSDDRRLDILEIIDEQVTEDVRCQAAGESLNFGCVHSRETSGDVPQLRPYRFECVEDYDDLLSKLDAILDDCALVIIRNIGGELCEEIRQRSYSGRTCGQGRRERAWRGELWRD